MRGGDWVGVRESVRNSVWSSVLPHCVTVHQVASQHQRECGFITDQMDGSEQGNGVRGMENGVGEEGLPGTEEQ